MKGRNQEAEDSKQEAVSTKIRGMRLDPWNALSLESPTEIASGSETENIDNIDNIVNIVNISFIEKKDPYRMTRKRGGD